MSKDWKYFKVNSLNNYPILYRYTHIKNRIYKNLHLYIFSKKKWEKFIDGTGIASEYDIPLTKLDVFKIITGSKA